jgi:hypothetical protein
MSRIRAFERYLGHKGGAFMNEISALMEGSLEIFSLFLPCEDIGRNLSFCNLEQGTHCIPTMLET